MWNIIYLNVLRKICTPHSLILQDFYLQCKRIRLAFSYLLEESYREEIQEFILLCYISSMNCSLSNEYLFFLAI
jgi:hypothetical protein